MLISLLLAGAQIGLSLIMAPRNRQTPTDSGKFDDVRVTGSEYGTFIPRVFGKARLGGNVVWSTGIDHRIVDVPSGGGKGIPQAPAQRQHFYFTDVGIQIARGEIVEFERVWADADLVVDRNARFRSLFEAEDGILAGTAFIVDPDDTARGGRSVEEIGNQGYGTPGTVRFILDGAVETPDLPPSDDPDEEAQAWSRYEIFCKTTDGTKEFEIVLDTEAVQTILSVNPGNTEGEWRIFTLDVQGFHSDILFGNPTERAPDLDAVRVVREYRPTASAQGFNQVGSVTGFKDPDYIATEESLNTGGAFNFTPEPTNTGVVEGNLLYGGKLRFYLGTSTQPQDLKHIAYLEPRYPTQGGGLANTPAYRDTVMAVFEGLYLKQGRVPNFTFEFYNNRDKCNDVLEAMCDDVGIGTGLRDFTQTDDFAFIGYVENTKQSRRSHIENLERYFGFRITEIDGKLTSIVDDGEARYNISTNTPPLISFDVLRSHLYGDAMPEQDYKLKLPDPVQLSREVRFSVLNPRLEYHNETVSAQIEEGVSSVDAQEFTFPIVDDMEQARRRAEFMLLKMHAEQQRIEFEAMPEMMRYAVGDLITLDIEGEKRVVRIEKKQAQMPMGVVKFEGVLTDNVYVTALDTPVSALTPLASDQLAAVSIPRTGKVVPIISLPITDAERGKLGVYAGVANAGVGASQGTALYREYGADNYILQQFYEAPSVMGVTDGTLGTHATPETEDTVNTLDILFYDDIPLESVTSGDLDDRPTLNLIRIGDEWVQFRTATKQTLDIQSPFRSKWRISNLRRGRFSTTGAIATHGASEDAVFVSKALRFIALEDADIGETVTFKAVAGGQTLDDVSPVSFTFNPPSRYTVTNSTDDRTFDADCTTVDELADVVATIIKDTKL